MNSHRPRSPVEVSKNVATRMKEAVRAGMPVFEKSQQVTASGVGIRAFNIQIPENSSCVGNIKRLYFTQKTVVEAALVAGKAVIESLSKDELSTIGLVLFGGTGACGQWLYSPSAELQYKLGISYAFAYDIFNGCNSLHVCLQTACDFLEKNSEKKRVLILLGDELSKIGDLDNPEHKPLWSFGDSAAALLVEKDCPRLNIRSQFFITDGQFFDDIQYNSKTGRTYLDSDLRRNELLAHAYEQNYTTQIKEVLVKENLALNQIKAICMNQGSPETMNKVEKNLKLAPDTIIRTYKEYGHLGAADVLIGLDWLLKGKTQLKVQSENYIILASSAIGYSWGCTVVKI